MRGLIILFLLIGTSALAQVPVIVNIEPETIYPGGKVVITGSGFSATASQLSVWFDNVKASVITSSEFSIEVTVPVNARHGSIEVINLTSKLSAKSEVKFSPSYNGESITTANASTKFSLVAPSVVTHNSEVLDVCTCDFDLDGLPDLAGSVDNNLSNVIKLAKNMSSGPGSIAFGEFVATNPKFNLTMNFPTTNLACGDLNGDGKPEIVGTRAGSNSNEILIKTNRLGALAAGVPFGPDAPLQLSINPTEGARAYRVVIHDVDKDGKPDLVVSNATNALGTPSVSSVYVFRNTTNVTGVISFGSPVKIPVKDALNSYGLEVQDLDGDRKPEIILSPFNASDVFILRNKSSVGQISFEEATRIAISGSKFNHLVTADFNNDGKYDIGVTNSSSENKVHVLMNTSTSTAFTFNIMGPFTTGDGAWGIDAADIDGDGDIDAVIGNQDFIQTTLDRQITFLINDGNFPNIGFASVNIDIATKSRNIEIADFDKDGKMDIAFTSSLNGNSIEVMRNLNCFVPKILNEPPVAICSGQSVTLESVPNAGASFQWKLNGGDVPAQTNTTATIDVVGSYTIAATSEGGSCATTSSALSVTADTQSVTQNPVILNAVGGVITVCPNTSLQLSTSTSEPTYSWTGPNGFTSSAQNPAISGSITTAEAGIYTLQVLNGVCKSNETTVRVDVASLESYTVNSSVPSSTICQGSTLQLSTGSQASNTYQWVKDGADLAGQITASLSVNTPGSYKVKVTNALGCSVETEPLEVKVLAPPAASFEAPPSGCVAQAVTFTNTTTADPQGTVVHAWNFGNTQTSFEVSPSHTYTTAQNFNVSLTVSYTGVTGCTDTEAKTLVVNVPADLAITASDTGFCPETPVVLTLPAGFSNPVWSTNQTTNSIEVLNAGEITVTASDGNNCSSTESITIVAKEIPSISITSDPTPASITPGLTVRLAAAGADTYEWTPIETLTDPTSATPIAAPLETTIYTVVGKLADGCSGEAFITIEVAGELRVTNVFSPNGDGINDLWVIPGIQNYAECTLSLFDSSGRRIFETRGYQNDWDGTYNGKQVPKGTYYYIIGGCPDKQPLNGHVLVAY